LLATSPELIAGCDPADILLPGIQEEHVIVLTALDEGRLVGLSRFIVNETKTIRYATLHDVFVDPDAGGRGIGKALTQAAIDLARDKRLAYLELTSRPKREAANHIYQSLGFTLLATANGDGGTNYYRHLLQ
jgi:ribosomal protein S18 acetylase RimI-like enzyme